MYYPFLRGRQNELLALKELAVKIQRSDKIVPIIEPVNINSTTRNALKEFKDKSMPFILISNPANGSQAPTTQNINDIIYSDILDGYNCYKMGYIISERTTLRDLENFVRLYGTLNLCLIHYYNFVNPTALATLINRHPRITTQVFIADKVSRSYFNIVKNNTENVIIKDCFNKARKNALYPDIELFSDLHLTFNTNGFDGFGDFSIVGDDYTESGGPAFAVAIHHIHRPRRVNELWIRHFISDSNRLQTNPGGKFAEALEKLNTFLSGQPANSYTDGIREFVELHRTGHFPGLGVVKKISIKHHIELMISVL